MSQITGKHFLISNDQLEKLTCFLQEYLKECPEQFFFKANLIIEEHFTNLVRHSGLSTEDSCFVECIKTENPLSLQITITDHGVPFDPTQYQQDDVGLLLINRLADKVLYHRKEGKNLMSVSLIID